jgi:D-lactate dehydrogenase
MSIYIFESNQSKQHHFKENLPGEQLCFFDEALTSPAQLEGVRGDVDILSPFVHSQIGKEIIEALPNLRLIATRSTGCDHIDLAAAKARDIVVCNVPTYGDSTVAEHAFALILSLSRNLHKAYMRTTAGNFSLEGLQGFDLKGKTIGVVGTGHIGLHVVRIAKGFGMKVLAYDLRPSSIAAEILDFTYTDLDTLLGSSKIVTLHTPLNPHTRHLIGDHNIRKFKRGAILINTARGELIDTEALLKGLDEGWLSGAGLDVLEGEDVFSEEKQLLSNPNVTAESLKTALRNLSLLRRPDMVITPHIGFDSVEAVERILDTTIENIIAYRNGKVQNVVNA